MDIVYTTFTNYSIRLHQSIQTQTFSSIDYFILEQKIKANLYFSEYDINLYIDYLVDDREIVTSQHSQKSYNANEKTEFSKEKEKEKENDINSELSEKVRNLLRWAINENHELSVCTALQKALCSLPTILWIHRNIYPLMLQVIEALIKDVHTIDNGFYNVYLQNSASQNNKYYLTEYNGNYTIVDKQFLAEDQIEKFYMSSFNKFESKYCLESCTKQGYVSISMNKTKSTLSGMNAINFNIKTSQQFLTIEYLWNHQYIIVINSVGCRPNKDRNQYLILALNIATNLFESVKLEDALNYNEKDNVYLFKWKFDKKYLPNTSIEEFEQEDRATQQKDAVNQILNSIFESIFSNYASFSTNYEGFIILRRFIEFMDESILYESQIGNILFENPGNFQQIIKYYSCSKMYSTAIYRGVLEHHLNKVYTCTFTEYLISHIYEFIKYRHYAEVIENVFVFLPSESISRFYTYLIEHFDDFWDSDYGQKIFVSAFSQMDMPSVALLSEQISARFGELCKTQSKSFNLQNLVKKSPVPIQEYILGMMVSSHDNYEQDLVYQFLNHKFANFILSAICDISYDNPCWMNYHEVIIQKIDTYYQLIMKQNRYVKEYYKTSYHVWGKYVKSKKDNSYYEYDNKIKQVQYIY